MCFFGYAQALLASIWLGLIADEERSSLSRATVANEKVL